MRHSRALSGAVAMLCIALLASMLFTLPASTAHGANLLTNSTFDDGQIVPWTVLFLEPAAGSAAVVNGELCLEITSPGSNNWEVQLRQREMVIRQGHSYTVSFKARASQPTTIRPKIGNAGPPYAEFWNQTIALTTAAQTFSGSFTMSSPDDPTAEFAFHIGGPLATASAPFSVCLDDIVLDDPLFSPEPTPTPIRTPSVRVNQVGYLPGLSKIATIVTPATEPLAWQLKNSTGAVVTTGQTTLHGADSASGDHLHQADFSAYTTPGSGYTLAIGDDSSHPFAIDAAIYSQLKYDALAYFYHNRSGIPIEMPYAGGAQWTRPAGHVSDQQVACAPNTGCSYTLDVSGGWYDAGDHGKYVVNGGIAVWTLLNQYERALYLGSSAGDFADGTLSIPEQQNGTPDILDEARWQIEFLLKMQVPEGQPRAGMVHHKIHDEAWTGLPLAPHEDPMTRYLRPPSTAATLNLAATAAQCARIWHKIDRAFAQTCLRAAERAWSAAQANPAIYAPASDGNGGGAYNDNNVTDEFYWAASELYITTENNSYRKFVTESPYYQSLPTTFGQHQEPSMTWGTTQALGTISLAVVPNKLPARQINKARSNIIAAADSYAAIVQQQGYRLPFQAGADGKYPWGSNSFVLNNMIVLALAYDFTREPAYLSAVSEGMNYLLGRNPMDQSYISGYGTRPLQNPHHRFWAHQLSSRYPTAYPGAVSGGPNSSLQDPYAQSIGLPGCAPQKCFVDHIESWSTNEITINWNAPLAWVSAFLDEQAR